MNLLLISKLEKMEHGMQSSEYCRGYLAALDALSRLTIDEEMLKELVSLKLSQYVTPKVNTHHSVKAGTHPLGSRVCGAKLKEHHIPKIRMFLSNGHSCTDVARRFGVSRQAISEIKHGKSWKTLKNAGLTEKE